MEIEKKKKLLKYLYPNEKIRSFLCDDLYMELLKEVPKQLCISSNNFTLAKRKENYNKVKHLIEDFFENNFCYKKIITDIFNNEDYNKIINDVILGYVFFITNENLRYANIDIFKEKRSICYSPISFIDIL